ncbi:MAG: glycoside hydrolase family 3 C-terminal domain-containing protein [Bacteroidales bacterium]|nr:glycoside hydrolase family 3 C-terminal domain-containing protein [Bacteroidales bacterium]
MKRILFLLFAAIFSTSFAQNYPFQNTTLPINQRVEDLLGRLTLDEKLSLMVHSNPAIPRLGLKPYSWWNEALHGVARNGYATVYPMPVALAATFNPELVETTFDNIAREAHDKFVMSQKENSYGDNTGLTFFSPNINIFRDPRWGRGMETFGEDPYLTARMGLAVVRGLQGRDTSSLYTTACIKHLAVHSGPEGVRHEFDSKASPRDLWCTYLPAFEYIVKRSNVQQVMCGYNRLNGVPCCTNKDLLVDILRNKWHYDGLLVTDCWALNDCWERDTIIPRHKTHATAALAAQDAFGSEVDLECGSGLPALRTAIDSGYISEETINNHVRRILRCRLKVGVDDPELQNAPSVWHGDYGLAYQTACQSIVMLKNNGVLPFHRPSIALIGPNAADSAVAVGNYNGTPRYVSTVRKAMRKRGFNLFYDKGCNLVDERYKPSRRFWDEIEKKDVIVFVGGLSPELEGEELQVELPGFHRGDRTQIELPSSQVNLIKELKRRTGKPIVLVLYTGSALGLEDVVDDVDAILIGWYGGQEIGNAVVDALTNKNHSFGRLPVTFYKNTQQLPAFEDYSMQGRTYRYLTEQPLFPFGFGLNYGGIYINHVSFNTQSRTVSGTFKGEGAGSAIIQVYLRDLDDPMSPKKTLVAFDHLSIEENGAFSIRIEDDMFRQFNEATQELDSPKRGARFEILVGTSSKDQDLIGIQFTVGEDSTKSVERFDGDVFSPNPYK